jgi:hypothetical protein
VAVPLERGLHRAGPPEARPEQVRHPCNRTLLPQLPLTGLGSG